MKQVKINSVKDMNLTYNLLYDWKMSFFEALGCYMSGQEYLTRDENGKLYMADRIAGSELHNGLSFYDVK